jgi:hypothetical protein
MSDTLVYYLTEHDVGLKEVDNRIFFFYDHEHDRFQIRGTRAFVGKPDKCDSNGKKILPYSFSCNTIVMARFFLKFILCEKNLLSHDMYSFSNLPLDCNDITFDLLHQLREKQLEIAGYDLQKFSMKRIEDALEAVRSIYNDY